MQTNPPGDDVTVYEVIGEPPFETGGAQETTLEPFAAEAETDVGAPGRPRGIAPSEARDAAEEPEAFTATTVNVYTTPFVRPTTTH